MATAALLLILLLSGSASRIGRGATWGLGGSTPAGAAPSPISTFPLGRSGAYPLGMTTDSAGHVWFAEDNSDSIVEFLPSNSTFHYYHIPTNPHLAWIWFLVFAGGSLWFADDYQHVIWSFSPTTHAFANYSAGAAQPFSLAYDQSEGRIWFTSLLTNQIGYFQLEGGAADLGRLVNITAPAPGAGPSDIVFDGSGNLYVTETFQGKIIELNGTNYDVVRTWTLPTGSEPVGLAMDSALGRVWFTNHGSSYFGYVDLGPGEGYREYSTSLLLQNGTYWVTLPYWITLAPDGSVWFDEHAANRIARFDPTTLQLTEFPVPTPASAPLRLTIDDARGTVWFTEFAGDALAELPENASANQSVYLSASEATLNPSTRFLASAGASAGPPTFGFTGTVTGVAEPSFSVAATATSGGYEISVGAGSARPGSYTEAVCFAFTSTDQCGYVALTVPEPPSFAPYLDAVYIGMVALGLLIVFALRRETRAKRAASAAAPSAS